MKTTFGWIGTIVSVIGAILMSSKHPYWGSWLFLIGDFFCGYRVYQDKIWSQVTLYLIFAIISIYGIWSWRNY